MRKPRDIIGCRYYEVARFPYIKIENGGDVYKKKDVDHLKRTYRWLGQVIKFIDWKKKDAK